MIYDPVFQNTGVFSGGEVGKNIPGMGPFKSFKPNLIGPGGGKIKGIIKGATYVGRYFRRNPRFAARIGAVAAGAGLEYATRGQYRKALRSVQSGYSSQRSANKFRSNKCCCCTHSGKSRKRRRYY